MKQAPGADPLADLALLKSAYLGEPHILNVLPMAVYVTDKNGQVTYFNNKAVELWGTAPSGDADQAHHVLHALYAPEGTPLEISPAALTLKDGLPRELEMMVERTDGGRRLVHAYITPITDEQQNVLGVLNCLRDITEDKKKEKAHQWKQNELHKMIDEVEDYAIVFLDKNGIIQNWNKGAEKIKGFREDEIVGKSFELFYRPEDRLSGLPRRLLQLATDTGKALHEGWRVRKDSSLFWGSIVLTAIHDEYHNVIGFTKVTRDLTEKKIAEDRLKQYTTQLEFQNKELEQFAFVASHDMKEPLRKIQFYNSAVLQTNFNVLDSKNRDYLNRSLNAARRMNQLIEDLLTYSRTSISSDFFEATDLEHILQELISHQKEELEQKHVEIVHDILPVIKAVPFQIRQLFDNLISNSVKYRHPSRDPAINITYRLVSPDTITDTSIAPERQQYHQLTFTDNGLGFEPQQSEKIFEIFQRLNSIPDIKGSGIGLAICKRIVQNHQGYIQATGARDRGARFDIWLPVDL